MSMKMLKETVGERIARILEERGMSQRELARLADVERAYINQIIHGKPKNVGLPIARKIAKALGMSVSELVGEGSEELEQYKTIAKQMVEVYQYAADVVKIPLRGVVPAGYPAFQDETNEGFWPIPANELPSGAKGLYALKVSGNSLIGDEIKDGDILIIQPTQDIIEGKIYVLRLGNEVVARHVYRQNGEFKLVSSNHDYQIIKADEAEVLGRVILSDSWKKH
ncbi:MAG: XRE family transcriptional regulator [Dehalococcoidia bacterium]|jgi:repressor LexA